jgi:NADPH-dependent 2,4-dienoyl-CoA reductase/sulfur reductase-like enzyme/nitrite reductase/ring-hydroxylating ferredoxin subunit
MGGTVELKGPDLSKGAPLSSVPDGGMLLGHAKGEAVLVARRADKLYAVGATCSHYSGPLAEGLFVGETVRCPWHQACFDLKTGAPSAPAFNAIPCYRVEQRGDLVVVGDKLTPPAPAKIASPARVVIVGGGASGAMAAEALRRFGYAGSITLIGAEATPPVDRPNLSKDYLAGTAPEEWMELRGRDFYGEQQIDFRIGRRATSLDLERRSVVLDDNSRIDYDALVLATGGEPVRLDVPGADRVHYLRTLAQSKAIIAAATSARRAVVVGSSFIGLEVAASLRTRGLEVDVVGIETQPLERVFGVELASFVRELHGAKGVRFHLGRRTKSFDDKHATLDDGTQLDADLVVAGIGVRPRVELAQAAGLPVDRGVLVDEQLRAAPNVYAIGDIARFPDRRSGEHVRVEHWAVAQRHGEEVAHAILGQPFRRRTPFFWSVHYDLTINYVGHAEGFDRVRIDGDLKKRDALVRYERAGKLLAAATIGRDLAALEIARELEEAV